MPELKRVDHRFASAVEDVTLPEEYDPEGYSVSHSPAMEIVDGAVVGYLHLEKDPVPGHPDYDDGTEYETLVLGLLEGEEFEPVEEPNQREQIRSGLGLNKGPVRFLDPGVPAPPYSQF